MLKRRLRCYQRSGAPLERIKLLQQEPSESVNEQTNPTLTILTVVIALVLPTTLLAYLKINRFRV